MSRYCSFAIGVEQQAQRPLGVLADIFRIQIADRVLHVLENLD